MRSQTDQDLNLENILSLLLLHLYASSNQVDDWMRERGVQDFEPPVEQKIQRSLKAFNLKLQRRARQVV